MTWKKWFDKKIEQNDLSLAFSNDSAISKCRAWFFNTNAKPYSKNEKWFEIVTKYTNIESRVSERILAIAWDQFTNSHTYRKIKDSFDQQQEEDIKEENESLLIHDPFKQLNRTRTDKGFQILLVSHGYFPNPNILGNHERINLLTCQGTTLDTQSVRHLYENSHPGLQNIPLLRYFFRKSSLILDQNQYSEYQRKGSRNPNNWEVQDKQITYLAETIRMNQIQIGFMESQQTASINGLNVRAVSEKEFGQSYHNTNACTMIRGNMPLNKVLKMLKVECSQVCLGSCMARLDVTRTTLLLPDSKISMLNRALQGPNSSSKMLMTFSQCKAKFNAGINKQSVSSSTSGNSLKSRHGL